jgi:hypothetical protein
LSARSLTKERQVAHTNLRVIAAILGPLLASASCSERSASTSDVSQTLVTRTGDTVIVRTSAAGGRRSNVHLEHDLTVSGDANAAEYQFAAAWLGAARTDGSLVVFDAVMRELREYDASGRYIRSYGRVGSGPGEYQEINGLAVLPDGRLAVADARNARVTLFSGGGEYLASRETKLGIAAPNVLYVDRNGRITLRGALRGSEARALAYLTYSADGAVIDTTYPPDYGYRPAALDVENCVTVPPFTPEVVHTWSPNGQLVVGLPTSYRFEVISDTAVLRIEKEAPLARVLPEERAEHRKRTIWLVQQCYPDWQWGGADIPETKPAYQTIRVDATGRYWVRVHNEASKPASDTVVEGGSGLPSIGWREREQYDIFDPNGTYVGQITLPNNFWVLAIGPDFVWRTVRDTDGVPQLQRFRLVFNQ